MDSPSLLEQTDKLVLAAREQRKRTINTWLAEAARAIRSFLRAWRATNAERRPMRPLSSRSV